MQLVGVEITYEGIERNLGVKSGRNYAEIVVVNRYANQIHNLSNQPNNKKQPAIDAILQSTLFIHLVLLLIDTITLILGI